jgi:hypothetical protein
MTISDKKLPDPFSRKSLFFGRSKVRFKILVDLLPDEIRENARGLNDLSIFRKDLLS